MANKKSLISIVERDHIVSLLDHGKRTDGRAFDEYREAEGSAIVKIGRTKVIAGVKAQLGNPYPDTPNSGVVTATVELTPIGSPDFESGPPRDRAIEVARVTDRAIRALVLIPGKKVWILFIDLYVLDHDGNMFDACELAALSALKNTQIPEFKIVKDDNGEETVELLETTKPLQIDHFPISCTFAKLGKNLILDPGLKEETIQDTRLTLSFTEENKICATQKGETGSFTTEEIKKCIDIAEERSKEIRSLLDKVSDPEGNPWSEDVV